MTGRAFFEEVFRENLDIGRRPRCSSFFERRVLRSTLGRFRTRVVTEGVTPWLYIDCPGRVYGRKTDRSYTPAGYAVN